jgi:hypothetical protein
MFLLVFALLFLDTTIDAPPESKSPNPMSPKMPVARSINPGSRQRNPSEIHRPRLPVELTTEAQETPRVPGEVEQLFRMGWKGLPSHCQGRNRDQPGPEVPTRLGSLTGSSQPAIKLNCGNQCLKCTCQ